MPTIATPNILSDPGYLFWAPLGTAIPTHSVTASKFTDVWTAPWVPLGATDAGSTLTYSTSVEPIAVAELFDPVKYATTERSGNISFALADWTLANWKRAMNGGVITVTGATTTTLNKYTPAQPGNEIRAMLGWESLDATVRLIAYQCINGGEVSSSFVRAPDKATIPFTFNFEINSSGVPFELWTAGVSRA